MFRLLIIRVLTVLRTVASLFAAPLIAVFLRSLATIFGFFLLVHCLLARNQRKELLWGPVPLINNKYWSRAMRQRGWISKTLMQTFYSIHGKEDYDLYYDDLVPRWVKSLYLRQVTSPYFALLYMLQNASVVHLPFCGGPLGAMWLWRIEAYLFRRAGIRIIAI